MSARTRTSGFLNLADDHDPPEGLERWLPRADERRLSTGLLVALPLFVFYELALGTSGASERNAAELFATFCLRPLGSWQAAARWCLLALAAGVAAWDVRRREIDFSGRFARCLLEGIAGALVLGPVLIGLFELLRRWVPTLDIDGSLPARPPSLARAGLLLGGAAWEELFFRVGLYGALFVLARGSLSFLRARRAPAAWFAELAALVGSAVGFAAFHLDFVLEPLGPGGEPYDPALFTWRVSAGILLAVIYRWRGVGVAAWTHGLFNVGLALGVGFDVLK